LSRRHKERQENDSKCGFIKVISDFPKSSDKEERLTSAYGGIGTPRNNNFQSFCNSKNKPIEISLRKFQKQNKHEDQSTIALRFNLRKSLCLCSRGIIVLKLFLLTLQV